MAGTIRTATLDDAEEIARLSAQLGYPDAADVFSGRLQRLLARETHAVLVCEGDEGRLAGFIGLEQRLMIETGERVEIVALVVDADARRSGAGRALVAAAESWSRERGLDVLFLRSNVIRPEAHAFYPALGFERTKTQHVYAKQVGDTSAL
jgi:N-acetylglutamate synthase-like GNAT family acetyltransferase